MQQTNLIAGCEIIRPLAQGATWLAQRQGRLVALKVLESDCLLRGQLHPNIRDRLGRVRELAHVAVANLYAVERDGPRAYLVWEYLEGQTMEEWAAAGHSAAEAHDVRQALAGAVRTLHAQGIVHGAIHARNVIIDSANVVRLTHVSPLLYHDPAIDARAVEALCPSLAPFSREAEPSARQTSDDVSGDLRQRHWSLAAAAAVAIVAVTLFWFLHHTLGSV